jgi:hypothetical protein
MDALKRINFQRKEETRQNGGEDSTMSESRSNKKKVIPGRIYFT